MNLARKVALLATATVLGFGVAAMPAPAQASSWGCGGFCRVVR
ncbi:MAG TPA: hypothetical protein VMF51_06950 [Nocardioides sp.]|jgi:hypothetical protein|nr:hypothetical protein [Nocardioides sp.]HTW14848.1 hypothetical protein [Nocardioides sp.]